jgi:hypothetical protein
MALSLRVKPEENVRIASFAEKVNMKRLKSRKKMFMESKLVHELIALALDDAQVTEEGEIYIQRKAEVSVSPAKCR